MFQTPAPPKSTKVQHSSLHGQGLFAQIPLKNVDLGMFSSKMVWGDEAIKLLDATRKSKKRGPELVECTVVPRGWEQLEDQGKIQEPYVLVADSKHPGELRRINCAADAASANTRINANGSFQVLSAKAGEELLAWYGQEYANKIFPPHKKVKDAKVVRHRRFNP